MQPNTRKWVLALCLIIFLGILGAGLLFGQSTYGSLTGQVTDPSEAAIPGATVTLTNTGTNYVQTATSDTTAFYSFRLVPPGEYVLKVSAHGFADYVQSGITINANVSATQNVRMKVESTVKEVITVTAEASLINATTAELGTTISQTAVEELPLNGRDPSSLAVLAPGMVEGNKAGIAWQQTGFSFPNESIASANGGRVGSTYYMLDGVSNMDTYLGSNSPTPNSDATQEFRLITNNFSAAYGFSSGSVVSMATRSGSNNWHGALFEFLRNRDLNAKNWNSHVLDPLNRNQFGGSVGGPVMKNKLFFFFNYQGTRDIGGAGSYSQTTTPTQQMLNGDFSGLVDYAEAHNPACGTNYTGPQTTACGWLNGPFQIVDGIPNQLIGGAAALDPVAVQFTNDGLPGHVAPASGTDAPTVGTQNLAGQMFYATAGQRDSINEYTGRVDYELSKSQRVTVRSFIDRFVQPAGSVPGNVLSVLNLNNWSQTFGEKMWYFNEIAQHTWTISPTTVNMATVLWTQQTAHNGAAVFDGSGKPMCWSRYINVTEPACYMEGAYFGTANGGWTEPSSEVRATFGFSDTLIKTISRHTLSMGVDVLRQKAVENASNYPANPIIGFGSNYTGSGVSDWLLGYMSSYTQGGGELVDMRGWLINPYINDEFRVKPGLTLTLGLRWSPDLAPTIVGGRGTMFIPGRQSTRFPNAPVGLIYPGDAGLDAGLRASHKGIFEPRIGVAWQPKMLPNTSFHAAFGMFSNPVPYSNYNHVVDVAPFAPAYSPANPSNTAICATGGVTASCVPNTGQTVTGYMNFHDPWSTSTFPPGGNPFPPYVILNPPSDSPVPTPIYEQDSFTPNFHPGMTQSWNVAVEQQLSRVTSVRVAYVGAESYHQSYVQDANFAGYSYCTSFTDPNCPPPASAPNPVAPYSNFTGILQYASGGTASYNSLQVNLQQRMWRGLQLQSSFTWQKTIDVASSANIAASQNGINDPNNLSWSRGESNSSIPFTWTMNFIYHSPELKGMNHIARQFLGGWEISPIISWQSGAPFSIQGGNSNSAYGEPGKGGGCLQFCAGDRADQVSGASLGVRHGDRSQWTKQYFNPDAFTVRHDGTFGTSGRNIMHGPPGSNVDIALMKNWSFREAYKLQFRFEMFNALNHAIMGNPDTNPSSSTFGQINGGAGFAVNASRVGQVALKFTF